MTQHVRSLKDTARTAPSWREVRSPPAANDTTVRLIPLSRSLPRNLAEIALLRATLDMRAASELRAAALLVMLGLGLRKKEAVQLDVSDVVTVGAVVCVSVRGRRGRGRGKPTFLPVSGDDAQVLRAYLSSQHDEAAPLTAPLFYSIEHGQIDRLRRITSSSISYWLLELRMRARKAQQASVVPRPSKAKLKGRARAARL
jgi:integrase